MINIQEYETIALTEINRKEHPVRNSGTDKVHVRRLAEALESGSPLPPVLVGTVDNDPERPDRYLVDGWHRCEAYEKVRGLDVAVPYIPKKYDTWVELLTEAVAIAAESKLPLTPVDQARLVVKFGDLGVPLERVAGILNVPVDKLKSRTALSAPVGPAQGLASISRVALKRPMRHLEGEVLTAEQVALNARTDGMDVRYHSNQILSRLRVDGAVNWNPQTLKALAELRDVLVANPQLAAFEDESSAA